jgi:hypothetical protein
VHRDYDALRAEIEREHSPLTFTLFGHTYTTVTAPRLGDTFDLMDAPEPVGETEQEAVRALARFIRKMLVPEDRPRWDEALYRLGPEHGELVVRIATDMAEQYLARPTEPPSGSSSGRDGTGENSSEPHDAPAGGTG